MVRITSDSNSQETSISLNQEVKSEDKNGMNWVYAGGDSGIHLQYWNIVSSQQNSEISDHPIRCDCGLRYYRNKNTNQVIAIKVCVAQEFIPKENRTRRCSLCDSPHKNKKDNYCNDCRKTKVVQFGKYKGELFTTVLSNHPDYCEWVSRNISPDNEKHAPFVEFCVKSLRESSTNGSTVLTISKHKGKTYQQILEIDKDFCEWVKRIKTTASEMKQFKTWLESQ